MRCAKIPGHLHPHHHRQTLFTHTTRLQTIPSPPSVAPVPLTKTPDSSRTSDQTRPGQTSVSVLTARVAVRAVNDGQLHQLTLLQLIFAVRLRAHRGHNGSVRVTGVRGGQRGSRRGHQGHPGSIRPTAIYEIKLV